VSGGQSTHCVAPVAFWYVPGGHAAHCVAPVALWRVPGGHAAHCAAPVAFWYVPGGHAAHCVAPVALWFVPGGHAAQLNRSAFALKNPEAHRVHEQPFLSGCHPAGQGVVPHATQKVSRVRMHAMRIMRNPQLLYPALVPHGPQSWLPAAALKKPEGHCVHPHPCASGCSPARQSSAHSAQTESWVLVQLPRTRRGPQFCSPGKEHARHVPASALDWYVPSAQATHAAAPKLASGEAESGGQSVHTFTTLPRENQFAMKPDL